jgi:CarD family transcriptional regulator
VFVAFKVGEKVVYPNHGIGIVEEIAIRETGLASNRFYMLRLKATDSVVMVPIDNAMGVGLRPPIKSKDCERLLSLLSENFAAPPADWKDRYKEFLEKMRTGDVFTVAEVLKTLTFLSQRKPLSFREKRMLERARFLVVSELAIVMRKADKDIEPVVDEALANACSKHTRGVSPSPRAAAAGVH